MLLESRRIGMSKTDQNINSPPKRTASGNGTGMGVALGAAFGAVYWSSSGNMAQNLAIAVAIGAAIGSIFDFISRVKSNADTSSNE